MAASGALTPGRDELVAASADPAAAAAALARLGPVAVETLATTGALPAAVALAGASRWAVDVLATDPEAATTLADLDRVIDVGVAAQEGADALVRAHHRELLRIAGRDLVGLDDLRTTTAALSAAAAGAISGVLDLAGIGVGPRDTPYGRVAVVGMGKLGAGELNFASDVDLLLVADEPERVEPRLREAVALLRGMVRVDLGLRPEGRDGAMVRTVDGYAAHWRRWAEPWERQALLKAAVVAGDVDLGTRWADAAHAAVWDRPFSADDIRSVRALKGRAEAAVARSGAGGRDVKRGLGGIRDVEFAVQLLELVHGRTDRTVRAPATLDALAELADGGYVAQTDAGALAAAYSALRAAEHRLQLIDLRPAHVLPAEPVALDRLARSLGDRADGERSPGQVLSDRLRHHRIVARAVHERLWFRPLLGEFAGRDRALAAFGFSEAQRTSEGIAELTSGIGRRSRLMQRLLPMVLDWLSQSPDPDLGLLGLRRMTDGATRTQALVDAFRDSPEVARRLCAVLGTSRLLADLLVRHPDLVDALGDDEALRPRTDDELAAGVRDAVAWRPIAEQRVALHRFTDREGLRIGAADVLGLRSTREVGEALSRLAVTAVRAALDAAAAATDGPPIGVVALGRFGAGELSYPSDLDVVFVCDHGQQDEATRTVLWMLRSLSDGPSPIYDIDADLRPEGRDGPLVRSIDAWAAYVQRWAEPWERLAWVRARAVAGDAVLTSRLLDDVLAPWVWDRPVTADERVALRRTKARVEQERVRPGDDRDFHLKLGRGGLADIEFCVQLLQLDHGVRATGTGEALAGLRRAEAVSDEEHAALADAHGYLEAVRNRLFLVTGEPGDALPARPAQLGHLAASLGTTAAALRERHRKVTRRARRVVEQRFYGRAPVGTS